MSGIYDMLHNKDKMRMKLLNSLVLQKTRESICLKQFCNESDDEIMEKIRYMRAECTFFFGKSS